MKKVKNKAMLKKRAIKKVRHEQKRKAERKLLKSLSNKQQDQRKMAIQNEIRQKAVEAARRKDDKEREARRKKQA